MNERPKLNKELDAATFRSFYYLKQELADVLTELQRIEAGNGVDGELLDVIKLISAILGGLKGEEQNE